MSNAASQKQKPKEKTKQWTGKHVWVAIIIFFGVIFAANIAMVTVGIRSFPGEDTKQSYRQGLKYNKTIAARNTQLATGWSADITVQEGAIALHLKGRSGLTIRGLRVTGVLKHPAETDKDVILKFAQAANGSYIAPIDKALLGKQWLLLTSAQQADGTTFDTRNEIWLKQ
jgi:nitrogen fixation protein FixH